jgi:transcriptional regulator with XRE-family HTH domain
MAGPRATVRQRRLARELRRLREGAHLTIEQVANKLELSPSTVSRIETAQVGIRPRDVRELLDIYGVAGVQRDELLQIARERRQQPWWQEYRDLPNMALAGFEADATSISQFSALLVPGLLQTEAYAREVLTAIRLDARPGDIQRRMDLRLNRQALLTGETAPQYWVVLDEAVVRRPVGGPAVMGAQLEYLAQMAALPSVTLQVLPFGAGAHAGMDGEFTIFGYRAPEDPDVVYIENTGGDAYIEDADVTRRYNRIFDHLRAAALDPAESVRTLAELEHRLQEPERG